MLAIPQLTPINEDENFQLSSAYFEVSYELDVHVNYHHLTLSPDNVLFYNNIGQGYTSGITFCGIDDDWKRSSIKSSRKNVVEQQPNDRRFIIYVNGQSVKLSEDLRLYLREDKGDWQPIHLNQTIAAAFDEANSSPEFVEPKPRRGSQKTTTTSTTMATTTTKAKTTPATNMTSSTESRLAVDGSRVQRVFTFNELHGNSNSTHRFQTTKTTKKP